MMFKYLLCIILTLLPIECLDRGDACIIGDQSGNCRLLSNCPSLLKEINKAGQPMPPHVRRKLNKLSCGFEEYEPLICCASYEEPPNFNPNNQLGSNENGNKNPGAGRINEDSIRNIPDISNHRNLNLLPTNCGTIEGERIFGGNRTRLFEMPWMVLLSYTSARGNKLSCGGTLITPWYVLTAAHCVSYLGSKLKLRQVLLGEYDVRKDPDCEIIEGQQFCAPSVQSVSIDTAIAHPGYSPQKLKDDIALIRLAEPADFTLDSMKPICLPINRELLSDKLEGFAVVAGWGATEDGLQSPVLLSVDLPIIPNKECNSIYNGSPEIYDTQLCAGGVPDKDSCGGDSGGPLMYPGKTRAVGVRYVQRGIVSFGSKRCGIGGYPGVYTRVASYMDWILDNIRD